MAGASALAAGMLPAQTMAATLPVALPWLLSALPFLVEAAVAQHAVHTPLALVVSAVMAGH